MACPSHGHIFCRECAISNLLAQNKELKRLKKELERRKLDDTEEHDLAEAERQATSLDEFERTQAGLSRQGSKRKFIADDDEVLRFAREGAKRRTTGEKSELPSFWVPGETPDNKKADIKVAKLQPTCPAAPADKLHDFTLKSIVAVNFSADSGNRANDSPSRICPSCNKALSNSTKAVLAKPCGHVLCKPCSDKFLKPAEKSAHDEVVDDTVRCFVCQEDITPGRVVKRKKGTDDALGNGDSEKAEAKGKVERGLVELSSEGTGFAGGGKNMVKKQGVAFQC